MIIDSGAIQAKVCAGEYRVTGAGLGDQPTGDRWKSNRSAVFIARTIFHRVFERV